MVQFANFSWMMLGLDLLAKITLLLLLAIVLDAMLKRYSAAARHCLWVACFVGLLMMPFAFWITPGIQLDIWPAAWSQPSETRSIVSNQLLEREKTVQFSVSPSEYQSNSLLASSSGVEPAAAKQSRQSKLRQVQPTAVADQSTSSESHEYRTSLWFAGFWLVGSAFSLLPLVMGIITNRKLRLISSISMDPLLVERYEQLFHRLKVTRRVELRVLDQETVPMTWGIFRPVILLPRVAEQWTAERLESVLLHELAHVQRLDVLWQVLARITCSIYFFHPLVWYANRRLRTEREVACDDCVLINGVKSSIYAEQLLQLARENCSSSISYAAVAMAQRSGLERRVRAVLNRSSSRLPVSRGVAAFTLLAFSALALLLAIPKLGSVAISQEGKSAAAQQSEKTEIADADSKRDQTAVIDPSKLVGLVVDEQGVPLADVLIDAWSWYPGNETKTDKEGRFRLKFNDARRKVELRVMKDGYSPFYTAQQPLGVPDFKVTLSQRTFIEGVVKDSDGKPVPNVDVRGEQGMQQGDGVMIGSVPTTTKTDGEGQYRLYVHPDTYQLLVRTSSGQATRLTDIVVRQHEAKKQDIDLQQGVRFEANVINSLTDKPFTDLVLWHFMHKDLIGKTDSDGTVVIDGMLPGQFEFHIGEGEPQQFGPFTGYMPRTLGRWWSPEAKHPHQREEIKTGQFQRNLDDLTFDLVQRMDSVTIYVEPGVTFSGRVTDPDGNPVEGATVAPAKTGSGNSLTGDTRYSVKTDKEGRYTVVMPAGKDFEYNLMVHDGDFQKWRTWANGVVDPLETQPGEKHQIDLKLTRPAIVRGKVVAEGGRQVAGREVRAHAKDLLENRYYDPTVRTKEDGSFELKFVRPGEHWIQVEPFYLSADQAPAGSIVVTLEESQVLEDVELTLPTGAQPVMSATTQREFTIQLVDEKGKPVPNHDLLISGYGRQANFTALIGPREKLNYRWNNEPIGGDLRQTNAEGKLVVQGKELFTEHAAPMVVMAIDSVGYRGAAGYIFSDAQSSVIKLTMQPLREVQIEIEDNAISEFIEDRDKTEFYIGLARDQAQMLQTQTQDRRMTIHLPAGEYSFFAMHMQSEYVIQPIALEKADKAVEEPLKVSMKLEPNQLAKMMGKAALPLRDIVAWQGGEPTTLEALKGKVVVLDFWGYWCGPCLAAMPELIKLHDELHSQGLEIIAVHDSSQPSLEELNKQLEPSKKNLWNGRDLPFRIALAGKESDPQQQTNGTAIADYGIREFPTTLLIGPDGKVVARINPQDSKKNRQVIQELLLKK